MGDLTTRTYYTRGIAAPFALSPSGNLALATDERLLQYDLAAYLLTLIDEPFMEPDDGGGIDQFLFQRNDKALRNLVSAYLRDKLNTVDSRVEILDLQLRSGTEPGEETHLIATIFYRPTATRVGESDVYKFEVDTGAI